MSKDTIYREDAINAVLRNLNKEEYRSSWESGAVKVMKDTLEKMPTADRPQGEWKRRLVDNGFNADWVCSECGYRVKTDFVSFNFCPNCGCRMKGADDERIYKNRNTF